MRKIKNVWINNIRWYTIILEMVTEEKKENIIGNEGEKIRCQFDEQKTLWYFSIVDVIEIFANSTDARNYWKVLKNRLKKADLELVTKINQLKMKARDGKLYMTDTADQELMVRILETIPSANIEKFKHYAKSLIEGLDTPPIPLPEQKTVPIPFEPGSNTESSPDLVEDPRSENRDVHDLLPINAETDQTDYSEQIGKEKKVNEIVEGEMELLVDAYQTTTEIFIIAMIAGVDLKDLNIFVENNKLIIQGKRINDISENNLNNYLYQELYWTTFSRSLTLPSLVQKDEIETHMEFGKLTIRLPKII